jgi:hypothetical protein
LRTFVDTGRTGWDIEGGLVAGEAAHMFYLFLSAERKFLEWFLPDGLEDDNMSGVDDC